MNEDDSVEQQEQAARDLWRKANQAPGELRLDDGTPLQQAMWQSRLAPAILFRYCRTTLHWRWEDCTAPGGPLHGVISERRLRRCELGQEIIPEQAWQVIEEGIAARRDSNADRSPEVVAHAEELLDLIKLVTAPARRLHR